MIGAVFDMIGGMKKGEAGEGKMERQVELLCARCEALAREIRRLREDNRALRDNSGRAKQKIRAILSRLPAVDNLADIGGERVN